MECVWEGEGDGVYKGVRRVCVHVCRRGAVGGACV